MNVYLGLLINHEIINSQEAQKIYRICSINKKEKYTHVCILEDKSQHNQAQEQSNEREREREGERGALQQNVFLVTKISEEILFVAKNTALVTKYEFHH